MSTLQYLKSLVKDKNVASITPSSSFTVKRATRKIDFSKDFTLVEYGPGTGVFSEYLLSKMSANSRIIMIEMNPAFVKILNKTNDPRMSVFQESAELVEDIVHEEQIKQVDYILSGIPFSFLDDSTRSGILSASARLLDPGGTFLAYQTSSHLKKPLKQHFKSVETSYEFRNLPPMCIYEASDPVSLRSNFESV